MSLSCNYVWYHGNNEFFSIPQYGWTPLISAADNRHCDVVIDLLSLGADINAQNNVSHHLISKLIVMSWYTELYHTCDSAYLFNGHWYREERGSKCCHRTLNVANFMGTAHNMRI